MIQPPQITEFKSTNFRLIWHYDIYQSLDWEQVVNFNSIIFEISTVEDFSIISGQQIITEISGTSSYAEYPIDSVNSFQNHYLRAQLNVQVFDEIIQDFVDFSSEWSEVAVAPFISRPFVPTLVQNNAAPQKISVGVSSISDSNISEIVFQFSEDNFNLIANPVIKKEIIIAGGNAISEIRIPNEFYDRNTKHYIRAKTRLWTDELNSNDPKFTGNGRLFVESDWSDTLVVNNFGLISSDDIIEITADKITTGYLQSQIIASQSINSEGSIKAIDESSGGYVLINGEGIKVIPGNNSGNPSIDLPSSGIAKFIGVEVEAAKFQTNQATLGGDITFTENSKVNLSEGTVADPQIAPIVNSVWPTTLPLQTYSTNKSTGAITVTPLTGSNYGLAYSSSLTRFYLARSNSVRYFSATAASTASTYSSSFVFLAEGWTQKFQGVTADFNDVAYSTAQTLWVAVGNSGLIATSSDGIIWTKRNVNITGNLTAVAFSTSQNLWVAVSSSGDAIKSNDGFNWYGAIGPYVDGNFSTVPLFGVAFSESQNLWTVVGDGVIYTTSSNLSVGNSWTRVASLTDILYDVEFKNNIWITVGTNGTILTSASAVTWSVPSGTKPATTTASFNSIEFSVSDNLWIALGDNLIYTSTGSSNGSSWSQQTISGFSSSLGGLARSDANDRWVAVGRSGIIYNSSNGSSWSSVSSPTTNNLNAVFRSDTANLWVAVGASGTILTSTSTTSSMSWTVRSCGTTKTLYDIAYSTGTAPSLYVTVGDTGTIFTSTDLTQWTARTSGTTVLLDGVARSDNYNLWVAVGDGGKIINSTSGTAWSSVTSGVTNNLNAVIRSEQTNRWIAIGDSGRILTSTSTSSTMSWSSQTVGSSNLNYAAVSTSGTWVIVGAAGTILRSTNGTAWTVGTSGTTQILNSVARSESQNLWVAVGDNATILTSSDTVLWTARSNPIPSHIYAVTRSEDENLWLVSGINGVTYSSTDAITWTARTTLSTVTPTNLVHSESSKLWISVGSNGEIYTSPDAGVAPSNFTGIAVGSDSSGTARMFILANNLIRKSSTSLTIKYEDVGVVQFSSKASRCTLFFDDNETTNKVKLITQENANNNSRIQIVAFNPSSLNSTATTQLLDSSFTASTFSFYGAARFKHTDNIDYYAIALTNNAGQSGIYCFNATSGTIATSLTFSDSQGDVPDGGLTFDGTRFHSIPSPSSLLIQQHSTFHPGKATQNAFIRYAYVDAASGTSPATASTRTSTASTLSLPARAFIGVTIPSIPGAASRARIYARGADTDLATANAYVQISSGLENSTSLNFGDSDFTTGFNVNVGSLGPWVGATGAPAYIQSVSEGWKMTGDGWMIFTEKNILPGSAITTNQAALFVRDNGSGKTQLCVQFNGMSTPIVIATSTV